MKKFYIFLLLSSVVCISIAYAQTNDAFINALRNCTPYNSSGELTVNGINATSTKRMQGWSNEKCTYKETLSFGGNNVTTVCRFSKPQIQEIVSVADAYFLTQQYSNEELDTSSLDGIQNNPVAKVLGKYLQDPNVCTMEGLE